MGVMGQVPENKLVQPFAKIKEVSFHLYTEKNKVRFKKFAAKLLI